VAPGLWPILKPALLLWHLLLKTRANSLLLWCPYLAAGLLLMRQMLPVLDVLGLQNPRLLLWQF